MDDVKVSSQRPFDADVLPEFAAADGRRPADNLDNSQNVDALNAAYTSLDLPEGGKPALIAVTCLAHLKLLSAFQTLKEDIGYTDGLWQIFDSRAFPQPDATSESGGKGLGFDAETAKRLALEREKRWAVFVARAVDRYEAWIKTFDSNPLREEDMEIEDSTKFAGFPDLNNPLGWTEVMLPPIDVLMVWHAHMLNPRAYLEDSIRLGLPELWASGMPWRCIDDAIDDRFNYSVSDECKATWRNGTGRHWSNTDDSLVKELNCPACRDLQKIPWTTCGSPEDLKGQDPGLIGEGYGDGSFRFECTKCHVVLTKEYLEVAKFVKDTQDLLARNRPMPGTILDNRTGLPTRVPEDVKLRGRYGRTFPNRLIKRHLRSPILELVKPERSPTPSMETIRLLIEEMLKEKDTSIIKIVDDVVGRAAKNPYRLGREARIHTRKMMFRYWGNSSPFSLELGGAVMRQGIFTEKMHKIDWLHSPAAHDTMLRLLEKYERFTAIMAKYPKHTVVPTLDVDLAWHTHQLSPRLYFVSMYQKTGQLIDHDDKIEEDTLSTAFEWTSKTYQEKYGEVYSECTCWYCEAVRASHVSSIGAKLRLSKDDKVSDEFHQSGKASFCPPDSSAHISAHNSVRTEDVSDIRRRTQLKMQLAYKKRLDENYAKAQKRAAKKGRQLPPRDDYYYYHWGYPYLMYSPYVYPGYFCPVYYSDPGTAAVGDGQGVCAAGTCSGASSGGVCGSGVSGSSCAGGSAACSSSGPDVGGGHVAAATGCGGGGCS